MFGAESLNAMQEPEGRRILQRGPRTSLDQPVHGCQAGMFGQETPKRSDVTAMDRFNRCDGQRIMGT